jgi:hypothetical protein
MKTVIALLLLTFTFEASAQTIADIARRERARQKQVQSRNRGTYTNSTTPAPATPPRPSESSPAAEAADEKPQEAAAKPPAGPVDNQGRDEKYWRDAFEKARTDLRRAEENVQIQEARVKDLNTQLLRQSDIYNRENVLGPQITAAQKDLETARKDADQARNKVSNLEEELRGSGGLAGWAR